METVANTLGVLLHFSEPQPLQSLQRGTGILFPSPGQLHCQLDASGIIRRMVMFAFGKGFRCCFSAGRMSRQLEPLTSAATAVKSQTKRPLSRHARVSNPHF